MPPPHASSLSDNNSSTDKRRYSPRLTSSSCSSTHVANTTVLSKNETRGAKKARLVDYIVATASASTAATAATASTRQLKPQQQKTTSSSSQQTSQTSSSSSSSPSQLQQQPQRPPQRRRSSRGSAAAMSELAHKIVVQGQSVVFITGAGLSVASGVRPFRSSGTTSGNTSSSYHQQPHDDQATTAFSASSSSTSSTRGTSIADPTCLQHNRGVMPTAGLWNDVIWTTATLAAFEKDPLRWYNDFWLRHFAVNMNPPRQPPSSTNSSNNAMIQPSSSSSSYYKPNAGHLALQKMLERFENVVQITQNIDGLQPANDAAHGRLIEAHGRLGLYKCLGRRARRRPRGGGGGGARAGHVNTVSSNNSSGSSSSCESSSDNDENVHDRTAAHEDDDSISSRSATTADSDNDDVTMIDEFESSSDDSDDSDDDEDRLVHLGHRRKSRKLLAKLIDHHQQQQQQPESLPLSRATTRRPCPYEFVHSLEAHQLEPAEARDFLTADTSSCSLDMNRGDCTTMAAVSSSSKQHQLQQPLRPRLLPKAPRCPSCGGHVLPQALLFDEGYHAHSFYSFERMEEWIMNADAIVFIGTSFSVRLTEQALSCARDRALPVYNFNVAHGEVLQATAVLNASNILGPAAETLPQLLATCRSLQEQQKHA